MPCRKETSMEEFKLTTNRYTGLCCLEKYNGNAENVVIPDGVNVIEETAFRYNTTIRSVVIPKSVNEIKGWAFFSCSSLQSVDLPDGITQLPEHVFRECTALRSIRIPDSVTKICEHAFYRCTSLEELVLPSSLVEIERLAFGDCVSLASVVFPEGVQTIDGFKGCTSLASVVFPEGVQEVSGFEGCTSLTSVVIPKGVQRVSGFEGCTSLRSLELPETVTEIGYQAFCGCTALELQTPDSVEVIGSQAFKDCELISLSLPKGIKKIGSFIFEGCHASTKEVVIGENAEQIDAEAFLGCCDIKSIRFKKPEGWLSVSVEEYRNNRWNTPCGEPIDLSDAKRNAKLLTKEGKLHLFRPEPLPPPKEPVRFAIEMESAEKDSFEAQGKHYAYCAFDAETEKALYEQAGAWYIYTLIEEHVNHDEYGSYDNDDKKRYEPITHVTSAKAILVKQGEVAGVILPMKDEESNTAELTVFYTNGEVEGRAKSNTVDCEKRATRYYTYTYRLMKEGSFVDRERFRAPNNL